ncbi:CENP-B homolog protein 2-like [Medicago truncatula]|uniref:CENP-B homolog protein 2-like n=1 Tax=Medicago truncatula TaxID=3880 RepID=UPI0019673A96|nr:CENP-B homolog protein 2-like [Medicago truncatula]
MASHLKGVAKSTMSDQIRKELCEYKRDNPASTQKDLQRWLEGKFQLKVSQGTISNTLKRSNDYLSAEIEKGRAEIKRHKPAKYPDMEKVVYEWFLQHQERVNITGELILQKARDTKKLLYPHDDSDFNFSTGWLGKFKHRHGIKSFRRFGESGPVDVQDMEHKLVSIREKIDQFSMKDVRSFDQMMHGRRVLLVVDNCPAHPRNIEGLRNVELFFLPPNMTSKIQPCDAGIIRAFKMHYRRRFYRKILEGYEVGQSDPGKINVLDAINLAIPAWTIDVRKETIANCFRHCKIRSASDVVGNLDESTFDEETQDLQTMINQCGYRNKMDIDNLMNYPGENEACSEVQSLEDIVRTNIENNAEDDDEDDTVSLEPVTRKEALMASNTLHNFIIQYKNTTPQLLDAIRKI